MSARSLRKQCAAAAAAAGAAGEDWAPIIRMRHEELRLKKQADDRLDARLQEIERQLDRMRESSRPLVVRAWLRLIRRPRLSGLRPAIRVDEGAPR